jgi:tRNA(Phe) wybutosine-synthesizing methylase Tyw3
MKQAARVLGRWHDAPSAEALRAALEVRPAERHAWLLLQAPILHVAARDLAAARALLLLGHAAGLKASHVRSFGPAGRVTVELAGTARVECPVAGPELATSAEHVALLARGAPGLLALGHARLDALAERARISSVGGAASHPGPIRAVQGSAENR